MKLPLPAVLLVVTCSAAAGAEPETAAARTGRFLAAMGGRAAWADVRSVVVRATHHDVSLSEPYANAIHNDFAEPRVRFEARGPGLDRVLVFAGADSWRTREGVLSPLTPERLRDEQRWWEANIYRTLHRLARGDPELSTRAVGERRLEVWRADGVRLNWFDLNAAGEPVRFGTWESEQGTVFGPLGQAGALRYPRWGASADGSFRYEITSFAASAGPPAVSFAPPAAR